MRHYMSEARQVLAFAFKLVSTVAIKSIQWNNYLGVRINFFICFKACGCHITLMRMKEILSNKFIRCLSSGKIKTTVSGFACCTQFGKWTNFVKTALLSSTSENSEEWKFNVTKQNTSCSTRMCNKKNWYFFRAFVSFFL